MVKLTPAAICWRRLVCFSSSSWLKTWSLPGSTLVEALNQKDLVYGDRTAFMCASNSGDDVTKSLGPTRAMGPMWRSQRVS